MISTKQKKTWTPFRSCLQDPLGHKTKTKNSTHQRKKVVLISPRQKFLSKRSWTRKDSKLKLWATQTNEIPAVNFRFKSKSWIPLPKRVHLSGRLILHGSIKRKRKILVTIKSESNTSGTSQMMVLWGPRIRSVASLIIQLSSRAGHRTTSIRTVKKGK